MHTVCIISICCYKNPTGIYVVLQMNEYTNFLFHLFLFYLFLFCSDAWPSYRPLRLTRCLSFLQVWSLVKLQQVENS